MACGTEVVSRNAALPAVWIVAVRARHAGRVHAALEERAVFVDLIEDLPIRVVQPRVEQRGTKRIEERVAGRVRVAELRPPRVALGADVDFDIGGAGRHALRDPGALVIVRSTARISDAQLSDEKISEHVIIV